MKDFQEFKRSIDEAVLKKWDDDILDGLIPQLDMLYKDDPITWRNVFVKSYSVQTTMRMLEAYHNWLVT